MTARAPASTTRRQRTLAAVVAFAVILAGFISEHHQAVVSHVRCEHGELTHASSVPSTGGGASTLTELPGTPAAAHGHEHCALATALLAIEQTHHIANITLAIDTFTPASLAPAAVAPSDCIYRTAPKTSPPA